MEQLLTSRLKMRKWRQEDILPFSKMNSDSQVMEFFPKVLTEKETHDLVQKFEERFSQQGFGFWALELIENGQFIGFTGLNVPAFQTHFTPCVEIGWRIAHEYWGKGLAVEAAQKTIEYGFEVCSLKEIVAFTTLLNMKSRRVMEKLGMTYSPKDDFEHPLLEVEHPLRKHVLYRLKKESYQK